MPVGAQSHERDGYGLQNLVHFKLIRVFSSCVYLVCVSDIQNTPVQKFCTRKNLSFDEFVQEYRRCLFVPFIES